jgi:hypothetical protein
LDCINHSSETFLDSSIVGTQENFRDIFLDLLVEESEESPFVSQTPPPANGITVQISSENVLLLKDENFKANANFC